MNRSASARVAALTRWSRERNRSGATADARAAAFQRFERAVDPDGTMTPEDRYKAARAAQRVHMIRIRDKQAKAGAR